MGEARLSCTRLALVAGALLLELGCSTTDPEAVADHADAEPPRVPNPPPRYAYSGSAPGDAGALGSDGGLVIRCGGREPFVCLRDGEPVCSEWPCLPDCTRVGCVGGMLCTPCEGGAVCLAEGERC